MTRKISLDSEFQYGDKVHIGLGKKGGAGMSGTIHSFHGDDMITVKSKDTHYNGITKKQEHKFWKGHRSKLTRESAGVVAARVGTIAAKTLYKASSSQGGKAALGTAAGIAKGVYDAITKPKTTTGGQFGAEDGKFKTGGKIESVDECGGYASGREAVKKMLDANKAKAKAGIKKEGYAGGAQISHSHGNPAPDLTKDTKVSTAHRPGRSSSNPAISTPSGYGTKARDLTRNSNPQTRHRPLTTGRIRESEEDMNEGKTCSCGKCNYCRSEKAKQGRINLMKSKAQSGNPQSKTPWWHRGHVEKYTKKENETPKDLRQIVEMSDYPAPTLYRSSKEQQKMSNLHNHAHEYCHHKGEEWHHDQMHGREEEENGSSSLSKAHYHRAEHHRLMAQHHADQLAKDHGLNHKDIADAYEKHKGNSSFFTTALAAHLPKSSKRKG